MAGQAVYGGIKCLVQNGVRWTYAEYDRFKKKWVPEPKPLDTLQANTLGIAFHTGELKKLVLPIVEQFKRLQDVVENLERIVKEIDNGK